MCTYRITKYNPLKRDSNGAYLEDDWTAISDINDPKYHLTYNDYLKIEDSYAFCVNLLKKEYNATQFIAENVTNVNNLYDIDRCKKSGRLRGLEVDFTKDVKPIKEGVKISGNKLDYYCRLCLREIFQLKLSSPTLQISFGFDFYMYVTCSSMPRELITEIERNHLFVEEVKR